MIPLRSPSFVRSNVSLCAYLVVVLSYQANSIEEIADNALNGVERICSSLISTHSPLGSATMNCRRRADFQPRRMEFKKLCAPCGKDVGDIGGIPRLRILPHSRGSKMAPSVLPLAILRTHVRVCVGMSASTASGARL